MLAPTRVATLMSIRRRSSPRCSAKVMAAGPPAPVSVGPPVVAGWSRVVTVGGSSVVAGVVGERIYEGRLTLFDRGAMVGHRGAGD